MYRCFQQWQNCCSKSWKKLQYYKGDITVYLLNTVSIKEKLRMKIFWSHIMESYPPVIRYLQYTYLLMASMKEASGHLITQYSSWLPNTSLRWLVWACEMTISCVESPWAMNRRWGRRWRNWEFIHFHPVIQKITNVLNNEINRNCNILVWWFIY